MEMLMKILLSVLGFFSALAIPFIGWVGISIVDLKVDVAETHGKVAANYEMIRPMWEEFLSEKSVANLALSDIKTNK
jgi:hypothetical protein